jgi:hemoglobin-like flavoprotein
LTPAQIQAVKDSFCLLAPKAERFGQLFYKRLFEIDPASRSLFKGNMEIQVRKLMEMLTTVVGNLDRLDAIVPAVESLGSRHAAYGVTDAHYNSVAAALLWTLAHELGDRFTPSVREAWTTAYTLLAETMKSAASR